MSIYNFFLSALLFTEYIIVALLDPRHPIIFGILGISGFITDFFLKSHNICIIILSLFITIRSIWIEHQKKTYQNTEKEIEKTAATRISETYAFKENNIIPNKIDNLDVLSISIPSDENQEKSRNNFVIPKK